MLSFADLKYIRIEDVSVPLKGGAIVIPPLDAVKEAKILELYISIDRNKNLLTDRDNASIVMRICKLATGSDDYDSQDLHVIFKSVEIYVVSPVYTFLNDPVIKEYLTIGKKKKIQPPNKVREPEAYFPLLSLMSYVHSRINIPDIYIPYLGLRFYIWAQVYLSRIELKSMQRDIGLLSETAYTANSNVVRKNGDVPFQKILNSIANGLGIETKHYNSIQELVSDMEENDEILSPAEYIERIVKPQLQSDN